MPRTGSACSTGLGPLRPLQLLALLADGVLHHAARLPGRRLGPRRAEGLLHELARLEQVRPRLLPTRTLGVLLAAAEIRLPRRLRLLLHAEPRGQGVLLDRPLGHRRLRGRELALPFLHGGQQQIQAALGVRDSGLGVGQDLGGDAEASSDGEAVGSSGDALEEPVGRRQRRGVELERGVHHARGVARHVLERAEMRGGQRERPSRRERHERGRGERRPFGRIRAAPHLVEQDEGGLVSLVEHLPQHAHVRAERGQAGRDALSVTDVGVEAPKDGQPASRARLAERCRSGPAPPRVRPP